MNVSLLRHKVLEGGSVTLGLRNLAATDDVVDAERLTFHVLQAPELGQIRVDSVAQHRFKQRDLARGAVQYAHTGGEVGQSPVTDLITVTVSDRSELQMDAASPVPLIDIEFDVLPQAVMGGGFYPPNFKLKSGPTSHHFWV